MTSPFSLAALTKAAGRDLGARLVAALVAAAALATAPMALAATTTASGAPGPLPALNIDRDQITVSGLSSGGYMAVQLGYAHSTLFRGVGVFAAGPYACARRNRYTGCLDGARPTAAARAAMQADIDDWSGRLIDDSRGVADQRVFLFIGDDDATVGLGPMTALRAQYDANGVPAAAIEWVRRPATAHVFPTDFDAAGNARCRRGSAPYIANCGYDGAGAMLTHLYGPLAPRNDNPPAAGFRRFDQRGYGPARGLATTGWYYLPAACAAGERCRLHVALHGCRQNAARIGDRFVRNTGYARWADTNRIVVLFPQTRADWRPRPTAASGWLPNPYGCFDWIGWYGDGYPTRGGEQVSAIRAMVEAVAPVR